MREMGLTEPPVASNPESGVVNAFQRIVSGTGEFEGATGYLFVSGFNRNQRVVTTAHGEICVPKTVQGSRLRVRHRGPDRRSGPLPGANAALLASRLQPRAVRRFKAPPLLPATS
jgi:hypothetical protein